jgi:carboxyl-terminal processing protease
MAQAEVRKQVSQAMSARIRVFIVSLSAPIIAFAVVGGFLDSALARGDDVYSRLRVFQDVVSLIMSNYVEEPNVDKVMEGAMRGLAEGLDSDSTFLTPAQVRRMEGGERVPPADVGLELTHQYYLRVVAARDGSPAAKAGILPGDFVRVIDGQPTRDMSAFEGQQLLRGAPASKVTVTVIRGSTVDPHVIVLVREVPATVNVRSRLQEGQVGYLRVASFDKQVVESLRSQIAVLSKAGAKQLIIDVRNTAGGEQADGIEAARLFVGSGTLAIRDSRGSAQQVVRASKGDGSIALPLAILIDNGTSGAAEVFAGALSGNKRAELVGERTIGRAATQQLVKLPDGSGLWMTSSRYLTPAGVPIQGKGIEPSVAVAEPDLDFGVAATSDPILDRALAVLAGKKTA